MVFTGVTFEGFDLVFESDHDVDQLLALLFIEEVRGFQVLYGQRSLFFKVLHFETHLQKLFQLESHPNVDLLDNSQSTFTLHDLGRLDCGSQTIKEDMNARRCKHGNQQHLTCFTSCLVNTFLAHCIFVMNQTRQYQIKQFIRSVTVLVHKYLLINSVNLSQKRQKASHMQEIATETLSGGQRNTNGFD